MIVQFPINASPFFYLNVSDWIKNKFNLKDNNVHGVNQRTLFVYGTFEKIVIKLGLKKLKPHVICLTFLASIIFSGGMDFKDGHDIAIYYPHRMGTPKSKVEKTQLRRSFQRIYRKRGSEGVIQDNNGNQITGFSRSLRIADSLTDDHT